MALAGRRLGSNQNYPRLCTTLLFQGFPTPMVVMMQRPPVKLVPWVIFQVFVDEMVSTYNSHNCRCEPVRGGSFTVQWRKILPNRPEAVRSCLFRSCCCSVYRHFTGTIPDLAIACRTQHNLCSELKPGQQVCFHKNVIELSKDEGHLWEVRGIFPLTLPTVRRPLCPLDRVHCSNCRGLPAWLVKMCDPYSASNPRRALQPLTSPELMAHQSHCSSCVVGGTIFCYATCSFSRGNQIHSTFQWRLSISQPSRRSRVHDPIKERLGVTVELKDAKCGFQWNLAAKVRFSSYSDCFGLNTDVAVLSQGKSSQQKCRFPQCWAPEPQESNVTLSSILRENPNFATPISCHMNQCKPQTRENFLGGGLRPSVWPLNLLLRKAVGHSAFTSW